MEEKDVLGLDATVRAARGLRGLTRRDLAEAAHLSEKTIANVEAKECKHVPSLGTVHALCEALGLDKGLVTAGNGRQALHRLLTDLDAEAARWDGVTRELRFRVLQRDGHRCRYCGQVAAHVRLRVDLITPIDRGGTVELANLVTTCTECAVGRVTSTTSHLPPLLPVVTGVDAEPDVGTAPSDEEEPLPEESAGGSELDGERRSEFDIGGALDRANDLRKVPAANGKHGLPASELERLKGGE